MESVPSDTITSRRSSLIKKDAQRFTLALPVETPPQPQSQPILEENEEGSETEDYEVGSPTAPWIVTRALEPGSPRNAKPVLQRTRPFRSLEDIFEQAWNYFDEYEEREANNVSASVSQAIQKGRQSKRTRRRGESSSSTASTSTIIDSDKFTVTPAYKGPTLPDHGPPTDEFVGQLINSFKNGVKLHYKFAYRIVSEMKEYLESSVSTVVDVEVPEDVSFGIVGDIHGQTNDLLTALKLSGFPSGKHWMLFNGDFVDRGPHGVEVLLILYSLKLAFPDWVFLNRGNHEHRLLNSRYYFELQVKQAYDQELYELIQDTFNLLPLATLCTFTGCSSASSKKMRVRRALVLHGGLPQFTDFTIDELRTIPRMELPRHADVITREEIITEAILWSDPGSTSELITDPHFTSHGWVPNRRGAGIYFGKALTTHFCKSNKIDLLIRSHQMVEDGVEFHHDRKLVTLFSASRYCGVNANRGAVAVVDGSSGKVSFEKYFASIDLLATSPVLERRHLTHQEPGQLIRLETEHAALKKISNRIFLKRHKLLLEFSKMDSECTGKVSIDDWSDVLTRVLRVDLYWLALWPFLGYYTDEVAQTPRSVNEGLVHPPMVNYVQFLDEYQVDVNPKLAAIQRSMEEEAIAKICGIIFTWASDIREAFSKLDRKGRGTIPYHNFVHTMRRLKVGLSSEQMYDFVRSLDLDGDGSIDIDEFISRFEAEFNRVTTEREGEKQFLQKAMSQLARLIFRDRRAQLNLKIAFDKFKDPNNPNKKGISYEQFEATLKDELKVEFSSDEIRLIFDSIDQNGNAHISFKEFKAAFAPIMRSTTLRTLSAVGIGKASAETPQQSVPSSGLNITAMVSAAAATASATIMTPAPTPAALDSIKSQHKLQNTKSKRSILADSFSKLQKYRDSLYAIFVSLDTSGSGKVSSAALKTALAAITTKKKKKQVLSDEIIESLYKAIRESDGLVDYHEFLMSFSVPAPVKSTTSTGSLLR